MRCLGLFLVFQNILMIKIQGIAYCLGHWRNGLFSTAVFSIWLLHSSYFAKRFNRHVDQIGDQKGFEPKWSQNGTSGWGFMHDLAWVFGWNVLLMVHSQDTPQVHIVPAWLSHFWRNKRNKINEGISMCLPSWCCCPPSRMLYIIIVFLRRRLSTESLVAIITLDQDKY